MLVTKDKKNAGETFIGDKREEQLKGSYLNQKAEEQGNDL